jgi:hypothetical protein
LLHERRQASMDVRETRAGDGVVPKAHKAPARHPSAAARAYGGFLELPVALVLAVMWLAGAALLGSTALVLYSAAWAMLRLVVGSI